MLCFGVHGIVLSMIDSFKNMVDSFSNMVDSFLSMVDSYTNMHAAANLFAYSKHTIPVKV